MYIFWIAVIALYILIFFCGLGCASVFYKVMINEYNEIPFTCPNFCPDFLFPKIHYDYAESVGDESCYSNKQVPLVLIKDLN